MAAVRCDTAGLRGYALSGLVHSMAPYPLGLDEVRAGEC